MLMERRQLKLRTTDRTDQIDEEEYRRVYEAETLKGTLRQEATNIALEAARKKYQEAPMSLKLPQKWGETLFGWSPKRAEEERKQMLRWPETIERGRGLVLSYIGRPGEAVKAGIKARIEKKPVLPAMKGGLTGEEEVPGRDILEAAGLPLDDPDWILDHPVQHFLLELGGASIELVTDPVLWALWFAPSTKLLKGAQKYLARKEITQFSKMLKADLSGVAAPGAKKVLLSELVKSPRYSKYLTKPWFNELRRSFGATEYAPFFSVPAKVTPKAIETLPKFSVLVAKAEGMIPKTGTSGYLKYWERLTKKEQTLELERKSMLKRGKLFAEEETARTKQMDMYRQELETLNRADITGKEAEKEAMKRAGVKYRKETKAQGKQLQWELGPADIKGQKIFELEPKKSLDRVLDIKLRQNKEIEEKVFSTGIPPSTLEQDVYIYNHTGKTIKEPGGRIRAFEKLLKKKHPGASQALSTGTPQISVEELALKITILDGNIARMNNAAQTEFESTRDFLYAQSFPEESLLTRIKKHGGIKSAKDYPDDFKNYPISAKRKKGIPLDEMADELHMDIEELNESLARYKPALKASDFDNEAYNSIEENLADFPAYAKRMELLQERDRYQSALLELRAKTAPPEPSAVIDQREVTIEPSPKLEEERVIPLEEKPEEEKIIDWIMEEEKAKIIATEQMKLRFGDVVTDKPVTPPMGIEPPLLGEQLFLNIIPPEDIPVDVEPWPTSNKDVGGLGWWRTTDFFFSDYQRATGIPIASEGTYPIRDASQMMRREEIVLRATVARIFKGIPKEKRIEIGKAMEGKKVELSEAETQALEGIKNLYKFMATKFNISPERMIKDYLPRIFEFFRTGDPGVLPKEMEAFFKKQRVGELKKKLEDPREITGIYIHAGLRDKYLYESGLIPDFVKHIQNLPFGVKRKASFWLTHRILRHPTRFDAEIAATMDNIPGSKKILDKWGVDSTTALRQITRGISQCLYAGGIGFRVISAGKNLTQQIHNVVILGPKYWVRGIINAPKKEEREVVNALNILRRYGAELERRGIDNPASIPQKVVDAGNFLFRKVDSGSRRICLTGTREMVSDAYKLLHQGKINKQEFLKKTKFDLLPFGRRPEAIELFNNGEIEGYANLLGKEFVRLGQYTYEPEDMPLIFSGTMGRLASVFMSWPIEFIEMQAHFIKTGHWENVIYYYLAAMAVQNGLRYAGIETNPYGYGDVQIGNHRISLIPGGWFLFGSVPTGFSPAIQIIYSGGKAAAVYTKGASDRWLNEAKREFMRSTNILIPFGLAGKDIIQAIEEIQSGEYGKRDKNGRLIYISDESEVILRGLGFTTPTEAEETGRYRKPIYEVGAPPESQLGKPSPLPRPGERQW